jgi:hypothetical protein
MRHPTRHPVLIALLVTVFALVTAGCGGDNTSELPKAQPPTTSPTPTDPSVAVDGIDPADLEVTDATGSAPGVNLSFASPIYSVTAASQPSGPTKVQLLLDNALPRTVPVFVVTRPAAGQPWTYLPAQLTSDQRHVAFNTTHLSDFAVVVMDLDGALQSFRDDLRNRLDFSINKKVKKPVCEAPDEARKDGYVVTTTKGRKTVFWCFGFENNKRVVRVVNRRVLPIQIDHPDAPAVPPAVASPKSWLPWAGVLGTGATFLPPGRTVTYDADLEPTKRALISAVADSKAQSMHALQAFAAALVARNNGFGAPRRKTVDTVAALVAKPQCAKTLGLGSDKMLAGCFSRRKIMTMFGTPGLLLAKVTTAPSTTAYLRQQFKAIALDVQQNGDQNILVRRAKPNFTAFVGSFTGETRSMVVNAAGLVFESLNVTTTTGIERVADMTYQLSEPRTEKGVSSAKALLTKVKIYNRKWFKGNVPRAGSTGTYRLVKGVVRSPFVNRNYCDAKAAKKGTCG